ncbi:hypothetical protein [Parafrankia sp. BMG5.11]|uniref:hypothetical protein n=1 Tax=Parafrankia sp. BMG5.11 TaxID=222540 RepID=UPI00103BE798|nr:hypothetical protein [Parafrankia sp. BMG5.11]TCJ37320.1 hypothetical protein E0504_19960 [Parafrankia sp. BMG5.11]
MRVILLPLLAAAVPALAAVPGSVALPAPVASPDAMMPAYSQPPQAWTDIDEAVASQTCGDRIEQVRAAAGQPPLDKTPAAPQEGLLIAAVDKRIDGCAVMQMHRDVNDVRPLPAASGSAKLQPAK